MNFHFLEVVRDFEECLGLHSDGDCLTRIDVALQNHAADWSPEQGAFEIEFRLIKRRPALVDRCLRIVQPGTGHLQFGLGDRDRFPL